MKYRQCDSSGALVNDSLAWRSLIASLWAGAEGSRTPRVSMGSRDDDAPGTPSAALSLWPAMVFRIGARLAASGLLMSCESAGSTAICSRAAKNASRVWYWKWATLDLLLLRWTKSTRWLESHRANSPHLGLAVAVARD